ncbi:zinc finger protein 160 isoform X2 [Anoplophora glabripennis]|uniref:zinc finger protein 160 isoform X2 n=1 Tax=Anoplophora glabripennis TaxID=217634 RepID=UPI00087542BD|nr:zinc finger protein 160 isoform X2 [Anoplophora glabripennis]XP_018563142.1 zinc finger protein 160 isoform X2 [Anoplophora glabripennis]
MVVRCCVRGCKVTANEGIKMHVLPKNDERRRIWCQSINRPDLFDINESKRRNIIRICDNHFLDKYKIDFRNVKTTLRFDASPLITLGEPEPSLDMSDANIVHITMPSKHTDESSNCSASLTHSSQFPEYITEVCEETNSESHKENIDSHDHSVIKEAEEEEYHCRTCLNVTKKDTSTWVTENMFLNKTIKDVIAFLVPEMEMKLNDDEVVCTNCLKILMSTMKFIIKCLEVDALLMKEKEEVHCNEDTSLIEKCENVEEIESAEVDTEHDYCGNTVSVGDNMSVEDPADIKNVTILDQELDEVSEGDSMTLQYGNVSYVENDVEIQYETVAKWLPKSEEEELNEQTLAEEYESYDEEADVKETRKCSTCMESFTTRKDYEAHCQIHPPYVCETCGKCFAKRDSLRAHRFTHNDPNSYICEVCGKGFKDYGTLRCHLKSHASDQTYICDKCSKVFKTRRLLDIHVKYVHDKVYSKQCTICGIFSKNEAALQMHMRLVHFKEKPFECNICNKKFGRSDYLHNHRLRHAGEPRIVSKRQSEKRKAKNTRKRRIIYDTGEPVPCKFCGQWYKDIIRLKRHLETHLKRYPCQFCPLTFPRNILCKRHEEIHRGGTVNFSRCNVCWKKFKTKEALDEHVKCHNNPQHFCDLCGKTFNRKFLLSHHKLTDHSNIPDEEQPEEIIYDSLLEVGGLSTEMDE